MEKAEIQKFATDLKAKLGEHFTEDVEALVNGFTPKVIGLRETLTSVNKESATHRNNYNKANTELETIKTDLESKTTELETIKTNLSTKDSEISTYKEKLDGFNKIRKDELQNKLKTYKIEEKDNLKGLLQFPEKDKDFTPEQVEFNLSKVAEWEAIGTFGKVKIDDKNPNPTPQTSEGFKGLYKE